MGAGGHGCGHQEGPSRGQGLFTTAHDAQRSGSQVDDDGNRRQRCVGTEDGVEDGVEAARVVAARLPGNGSVPNAQAGEVAVAGSPFPQTRVVEVCPTKQLRSARVGPPERGGRVPAEHGELLVERNGPLGQLTVESGLLLLEAAPPLEPAGQHHDRAHCREQSEPRVEEVGHDERRREWRQHHHPRETGWFAWQLWTSRDLESIRRQVIVATWGAMERRRGGGSSL